MSVPQVPLTLSLGTAPTVALVIDRDGGGVGGRFVDYVPLHVPQARFVLDRSKDLIIEVNLQFIFDIEGPNIPFVDLDVTILQWSIRTP